MTNYQLQLERLKRHYQFSLNHYDKVSFLDLAHTLRIWTETKNWVNQLVSEHIFKKGIITRSLKSRLRDSEYVYSYLPDGITTSASATREIGWRNIISGPKIGKFSMSTSFKIENNGDLTLDEFMLISKVLSQIEIKNSYEESKNRPQELVSFSKYMESPAIHFLFHGHKPRNISNEDLIKRIANEHEGSHADSTDTSFVINNIYSDPVKKLMKYKCAQLPLPYFVLLHIAKSIIENLDGKL